MKNNFKSRNIIISLSLFVIVFYAPLTISAFLSEPLGYKFHQMVAVIFILMAFSTFLSTRFIKVSFVLAPGVGIATLLANAYERGNTLFVVVTATLLASLLSLWASWPKKDKISSRQKFLNNLPPEIKTGIRVGIGTLLASIALSQIDSSPINTFLLPFHYELRDSVRDVTPIFIFIIFTSILTFSDIVSEKLSKTLELKAKTNFLIIALRSLRVLSPFAIILILKVTNSIQLPLDFSFSYFSSNVVDIFHTFPLLKPGFNDSLLNTLGLIFAFSLIICFVFIIDIPGSPYDMLKQIFGDDKYKHVYDQSFKATSISSLICSIFGLSTSVYYAENNIITQAFDDTKFIERAKEYLTKPTIAYICSFLFIITGVLFLFCHLKSTAFYSASKFADVVKFAIAPNLFCLGLHLTSKSLTMPEEERKSSNSIYYLPASLIILLIGYIGFEYSVLIGIICYCLLNDDFYITINKKKKKENESENDSINIYFIGSVISLTILFCAHIDTNKYDYDCNNGKKVSVTYKGFDNNKKITNININFNNQSINNLKRQPNDLNEEYNDGKYTWIIENNIGLLKANSTIIVNNCKCSKNNR